MKGKTAFQKLFTGNKKFSKKSIRLLVHRDRSLPGPKIAVCVSQKSGNAVIRNRLKRITREALDPLMQSIHGNCYMAFLPNAEFENLDFEKRVENIKKLLYEAGLMNNGSVK